MALIKYSSLVDGIRGTVGGVTFSANRAGPYAKEWAGPTNPRSSLQSKTRAQLGCLPTYWRALEQGERDGWDTWAADPAQEKTNSLGEAYYVSGFNQFLACNIRMLTTDHALQETAPVGAYPSTPSVPTVVWYEETPGSYPLFYIQWTPGHFPAGTAIVVFFRYIPKGLWTVVHSGWVKLYSLYDPPGITLYLTAIYRDRGFPEPQVGDQIFVRIYKQSAESLLSPVVSHMRIFYTVTP